MRYKNFLCLLTLVLCCFTGKAYSQSTSPDNIQSAKAIFEAAEVFFNNQDYDKAYSLYEDVYKISQEPLILFNMAQCQRLANKNTQAIKLYKEFLEKSPSGVDQYIFPRQESENFIRDLKLPPPPKSNPTLNPWLLTGGGTALLSASSGILAVVSYLSIKRNPDLNNDGLGVRPSEDPRILRLKVFSVSADVLLLGAIVSSGVGIKKYNKTK